MGRILSGLLLLSISSMGCEIEEYSLLLEVGADVDVQEIEVEVRSLERDESFQVEEKIVARDAATIAEQPLRVAISLPGPLPVAVRIVTRGVGGAVERGAFRCYQVDGVVTDAFTLVPSDLADVDGDGWPADLETACGEPCSMLACPVALTDCDDTNGSVNPGAIEACGPDLDCDGETRECADEDGDGHFACPPGIQDGSCDCDDGDPAIHEDVIEPCPSTVDLNCDGRAGDICDRDGDGFFAETETGGAPDCDDTNPAINPGVDEVCTDAGGTPVDENCNGAFDEVMDCGPGDLDGDGVAGDAGDCNDCDSGQSPTSSDPCGDGVDGDCDGSDMMCAADDMDGDGVRAVATGGRDCDDMRRDVYPGAPEQCTGAADEDCDGAVDEGCPAGDTDRDGYVEDGALLACEGDAARNPGARETCDGVDQDCDGVVDEGAAMAGEACILDLAGTSSIVSFSDSMDHCGGCRVACDRLRADQCVDGVCGCSENGGDEDQCDAGDVCCVGSGPACADLSADFDACGSCDNACDEDLADDCVEGSCVCGTGLPCGAGLVCCDGQCVDLDEDPNNCSRCSSRCGRGESCEGGLCTCFDDQQADEPREDACKSDEICCASRRECKKPNAC